MIRFPSLPLRGSEPANARAGFLLAHALGGLAGLTGATVWAGLGTPSGVLDWAALAWLASPLLLAALAFRPLGLDTLELLSTLNMILLLVALAAVSGGIGSVFLAWLILVPAEAALTRKPRHLFLAILAGCAGIGALWLIERLGALPPFELQGPLGAAIRAVVLGGALVYAGILAMAVQRVHRAAARAIAEREASYRFLADNAADPILRVSTAGVVLYASPASEEVFARPRARIERQPLAGLVAEEGRAALQHALVRATYFGEESAAVCRLGEERTIEVRCRSVLRADPAPPRGWFAWRTAPRPAQREIIAIARDITAHRALEERLERSWRTAEQQNRAKSRFLANMSHELRTPLNSILGFSEMIGREILGPVGHTRYREYAGLIQESGRYLLELINDILDIAKIESGKYQLTRAEIDVGDSLRRALHVMVPQFEEKGVALEVKMAAETPAILADARAVRQIVFNLLSNALKFTPAGGRAGVSLAVVKAALELEVTDTGIGISESDLKRLARPFEQADDAYVRGQSGTGLGLALVRALTALHGGTLTIRSKRGQGTSVTVSLPLPEKSLAPSAEAAVLQAA